MTAVVALLDRLRGSGVVVAVEGDRLILDGPTEALPDHLVALVRQHKPELLVYLRQPTTTEITISATCIVCGGTREPVLHRVAGRPAVRCASCGTWDLVGGAA